MQTLKDAATLGALLLLALTVRVDLGGKPVDVDLAGAANAAVENPADTPQTQDEALPGNDALALPALDFESGDPPAGPAPPRRFVWEVDGQRVLVLVDTETTLRAAPARRPGAPCASAEPQRSC